MVVGGRDYMFLGSLPASPPAKDGDSDRDEAKSHGQKLAHVVIEEQSDILLQNGSPIPMVHPRVESVQPDAHYLIKDEQQDHSYYDNCNIDDFLRPFLHRFPPSNLSPDSSPSRNYSDYTINSTKSQG